MRRFFQRLVVRIAVAVLLVVLGVVLAVWLFNQRVTEEEVRQTVITTLQAETPASFLVTGVLDITATTTVENTKYLFPDLLRLDLGTTRARVRLPGRVAYGFDVSVLRPEDIVLGEDGVVEVALPDLSVFSVEPELEAMEIETDVGWARTHARSGQRTTQRAMQFAQQALREQADKHLQKTTQPRINTAEALQRMLTPALQAAGIDEPQFRFRVGPHLVMEPEG